MESDVITLQDVFVAKPPDEESASEGAPKLLHELECTGLKPHFLEKMATNGVILPPNFFGSSDGATPGAARSFTANYGGFQ